jgi:peptidoglycan/LPS O-acetylase OafA/YrhL
MGAILFLLAIYYPFSLDLLGKQHNVGILAIDAVLLQAWVPKIKVYYSLNAPAWSVSCELFFYAMFPIAVVWMSRAFVLKASFLFLTAALVLLVLGDSVPDIDGNWLGYINPLVNLPVFALGIAAGMQFIRHPTVKVSFWMATAAEVAAVTMAIVANMLFCLLPRDLLPYPLWHFLRISGAAPGYAIMLLTIARFDGAVSRGLSCRVLMYLGEISYSLYLFHQPVIRWHSIHRDLLSAFPWWAQWIGVCATALVISSISYHVIEGPARDTIRRMWATRRSPPVVTVDQW